MAVIFKLGRVAIDGDKKGYNFGRAIHPSNIDTDTVAERIQRNCTVKKSDVKAVLAELSEVMRDAMLSSDSVTLDGIGTFSIGFMAKAVKSPVDFGADSIKRVCVKFRPMTYASGKTTETRADGTEKTHNVFSAYLSYGATFRPDGSVQKVIDEYEKANAGA